jgi:hypothetical protein
MQLLICEHSSDKVRADQHPDGQKATRTGDEAGITKTEQRISLDDFYLFVRRFVAAHRCVKVATTWPPAAQGDWPETFNEEEWRWNC